MDRPRLCGLRDWTTDNFSEHGDHPSGEINAVDI